MTIPLQTGIVYGPLTSRRFGKSLGINLLPDNVKVCNFDCLYCQYGDTAKNERFSFPSLKEITEETEAFFVSQNHLPFDTDWIMIAGNGEPTLHPEFLKVVEVLSDLRDQHMANVPIGILSNSSTCFRPEVKEALLKLDGRFMKLDAGGENLFLSLNRSWNNKIWAQMINGLMNLHRIVIQSMFIKGRVDNTGVEAVEEWVKILKKIAPEAVQIYTLDRSTAHEDVVSAPKATLEKIAATLKRRTGIEALVYG